MFTFLVSQPSNSKANVSGYRAFQCRDDLIHPLPVKATDEHADRNNIIQKFCYLRPQYRPIIYNSKYQGVTDSSDYLLVAKNNGIIEIIKDYLYKIQNNLSLKPDLLLFCVPQIENVATHDITVVGLEYQDRFLYVCTSIGDLFGFVLNLPDDYIQDQDFQAPRDYHMFKDSFSWKGLPVPSTSDNVEETNFRELTPFVKMHNYCHICYYCYPVTEDEYFHENIKQWYSEPLPTFSNCFAVFLRTDVSSFHINPMDRFSVITVAPHTPLTIQKILLPSLYVVFYQEFVKLKKEYFSRYQEMGEPRSFDFMSSLVYGPIFTDYLRKDCPHFIIEQDVRVWRTILVCDMVCEFKYSSVWRQKQGNIKDTLHQLFFYDKQTETRGTYIRDGKNNSDPAVELELDTESYNPISSLSVSMNNNQQASGITQTEKFLKYLRRKTFPIDFQVVKTISLNQDSAEEEEATTSFLTDTYKDMDIIILDKFLSINAFRPKYVDEPLMKLDSIHDFAYPAMNEYKAQAALNNLSAFKKFFMLTDSLCLIWDTNGVLLLDRFNIRNAANLLENDVGAIKVINFRVGVVNDVGLVITKFEKHDSDFNIEFYAVTTCLTGDIMLLKGAFHQDKRLGKMKILDILKSKHHDKFVDQILLLNYEPSYKRGNSNSEVFTINKKIKLVDNVQ